MLLIYETNNNKLLQDLNYLQQYKKWRNGVFFKILIHVCCIGTIHCIIIHYQPYLSVNSDEKVPRNDGEILYVPEILMRRLNMKYY